MMRRLLWLLPLTLLCACPPNVDVNDAGIAFVGPNGGVFIFQNEGVGIDVPKGALETDSQITVTVIDTGIPEVPMRKRISYGYRISPTTLTFKAPIKLFLPWQPMRVPQAVDPGTFDMRRQTSSDPYLALSGATVHADLTNLEAQTDRLGVFWLTSPTDPNVDQLVLDPTEAVLRVGDTKQFSAEVKDPAGGAVAVDVQYSCTPPRVCSITDGGVLTASAPGWATVTAKAGKLSETAAIRVQGDAVGPTSFVHENPYPTGNDLWGGAVLPNGLGEVFVGANGTVLTRDGAGVFTRRFSAPGITLKGVAGSAATNVAAIGTYGSVGVLVEVTPQGQPTAKTFNTIEPRSLWFDGTHGMAVGYGNDVLIRRNGSWVKEYSPSVETLLSVVGDGAGGFVTLGSRGSIYQFDPATNTWDSLYQTQLSVLLTAGALVSSSGQEAWAASLNKLWHFQNSGWSSVNLPAAPPISEVTSLALIDGKVLLGVRSGKAGVVLVYDPAGAASADAGVVADGGTALEPGWVAFNLREAQVPRGMFAASPTASSGYVVGDLGAVYRYEAGGLTELSHGFYGDVSSVAVAGTTVYAAVNECISSGCGSKAGAVYRRVSVGNFEKLGGTQPFASQLYGMAVKGNDVLVASASAIYHYDGQSWSTLPVTNGVPGPIFQLRFCGNTLYGVGVNGSFYRGTATSVTRLVNVGQANLYSLHCPVDTVLWVAGTEFIAERIGTGSFTPRTSMDLNPADWRAVWSPGQNEAFVFGDARYGMYFDTVKLNAIDVPGGIAPDFINAMWGSSIDNLYLVGSTAVPVPFGLALRFDGADFRLVDSGSQQMVTSIDGSSNTEVWLGTEKGGVLRAVPPGQ